MKIKIPAKDGFELAGTLYEPKANARAVVLISSATAVLRHFYHNFSEFLCHSGYRVVTYDYRGIGDSRPPSLRGFEARMRDWALLDMAGVLDWLVQNYGIGDHGERLIHVGHSFGGQGVGLLPDASIIDAMVTFSAQSGYWAIQGGAERYRVWYAMHLLFPMVSRLLGYFPWSRFAKAEDLPKGVAIEWARWCRSPEYLLGDPTLTEHKRYDEFHAPLLAYSFSDDDWGTKRSVDFMMNAYVNASLERRHVVPAEVGLKRIGHFGFFRPEAKSLWQDVLEWVESSNHSWSFQRQKI
ncbi:MAG: alpha/beta fold hydrolase [Chloroflexota bacterium]